MNSTTYNQLYATHQRALSHLITSKFSAHTKNAGAAQKREPKLFSHNEMSGVQPVYEHRVSATMNTFS